MSIKIYKAYRVNRGVDPFTLMWDLKRRGQEEAKKRLGLFFEAILSGKAEEAALRINQQNVEFKGWAEANGHELSDDNVFGIYQTWLREHCPPELKMKNGAVIAVTHRKILTDLESKEADAAGAKAGAFDIDRWIHRNYGAQLHTLQRNQWALDTAIAIRRYRQRYYLIPYCDHACAVAGSLDFLDQDERLEDFSYWNNTDAPEEVKPSEWAWRSTVWNDLTEHERWKEFLAVDVVAYHAWIDVSPMMDFVNRDDDNG